MAASGQPTHQQIAAMQQQLATEAAKRGMTPEEFSNMQRQQFAAEAAKHGLTPEQYINQLKAQALQQHQKQQQAKQAQAQGGPQQTEQHVPMNSNAPPDPSAVAVAQFLKSQDLKPRTCILDGQRKELFKVKRAVRALQSPAYSKAQSKPNSLLPPVTDQASAENAFKLLPLSLLALRVSKVDPHAGHNHGKPKGHVKGLWTVRVEQHQEIDPMMHYVWLYEGPQWKQKAMAAGVLVAIMAVVMFPLWPVMLRRGVWYLSVGIMGLLGLFFAMSIFRLILFCITFFAVPPGLWLYPNLFEDVGFFDSFRPVWGWQETKKKKSKKSKKGDKNTTSSSPAKPAKNKQSAPSRTNVSTGVASGSAAAVGGTIKRDLTPKVEEADDE
ncbi:translocation protein SEC62 [Paracoccidioides lutzii Pb01]|uniref:Translocation protein SEC62 n=1 Tax=Paracoccidioides lutzii (strain ATCC MYA-826 / Pb01) TaxID=502779 RepID=C1H5N3_PARBA|nr:translocation protein SEC62 [Paracoccidioides lutzii Pb01]EEH35181.1 translocation protein SEC62 [Paracoccidioides lutzii Pb01]